MWYYPSAFHGLFSYEDFDAEDGGHLINHADNEVPLQNKGQCKWAQQK